MHPVTVRNSGITRRGLKGTRGVNTEENRMSECTVADSISQALGTLLVFVVEYALLPLSVVVAFDLVTVIFMNVS
jgi:hypothetical protein